MRSFGPKRFGQFVLILLILSFIFTIPVILRKVDLAWLFKTHANPTNNSSLNEQFLDNDNQIDQLIDLNYKTNIDSDIETGFNINELSKNKSTSTPSDNHKKKIDCDNIDIALICGGFNATRSFYVLLKSILFHRKSSSINLHLMVNNVSSIVLKELFDSFGIPNLQVTFYNATQYEAQVSWITSRHYSRHYGLLKLIFLEVLASKQVNLKKVILMDTDMLMLGDIRVLWEALKQMVDADGGCNNCSLAGPMFGMVENQSDWYILPNTESRKIWPALGKGFNSGLILADLVKLLNNNWSQLWRQTAEKYLVSHSATFLADQDIFNAIICQNTNLVYTLPSSFNIQLNDNSKIMSNDPRSLDSDLNFQLIHWNSPYKMDTKNEVSNHYKLWYQTLVNWDGALLKQDIIGCKQTSHQSSTSHLLNNPESTSNYQNTDFKFENISSCDGIKPNPNDRMRTFLYFFDFEYHPVPWDVTLTVHLSMDRLLVLDQLAGNWPGPISVAIYLSEVETNLLISSIKSSFNLVNRKNIGYHLVYRDQGFNYPTNKLRNIALKNALTNHVLLTDIDFLPSLNLYEYLKTTIEDMSLADRSQQTAINMTSPLIKKALVIPAFETLLYRFDFPTNKAELLTQLNLGSITSFRVQIWPKGHSQTDYARWRVATKPYKVDWKPDYEPFVVVDKDAIRFDERFVGFGWNKVEAIMELTASGYEFIVLPESFLIHKIHSASYDILNHRLSYRYRLCINHLKLAFQRELSIKYPEFSKNMTSY